MCFTIALTQKSLLKSNRLLNQFSNLPATSFNYCISAFTFPKHPIITTENPSEISFFQWGLIPHWTKSTTDAIKLRQYNLNAKSETVFEKASFKKPIQNKRCLVPISGFYEWRTFEGKKYPYYINLKAEAMFMLGGIYDHWVDKETGEILNTFTILTTQANPLMAKIHNTKLRMPLIIPPEKEINWIDKAIEQKEITTLFAPYAEDQMQAHTVSKLISSKKENRNSPEAIIPFFYAELQEQSLF